MALLQRQMSCFENNKQFLREVAAILLQIAAAMYKTAMVTENSTDSTAVERAFASTRKRIAEQILNEQGITVQVQTNPFAQSASAGSSNAMGYLIQQMLLMPTWTLTPDQWAADEPAARTAIQASMAALLESLTAVPAEEA